MIVNLKLKKMAYKILIVAAFIFIVVLLIYSKYYKDRQNAIILKTQYTFSVRIDTNGNVVSDDVNVNGESTDLSNNLDDLTPDFQFGNLQVEDIANIWITEFTNQFQQKYISNTKAIKDVNISKIQVMDSDQNNVLIAFSCEPLSNSSDYFSSWHGYKTEGILQCEWVVQFELENLFDNTARIYVKSIQQPEDYGLSTNTAKATEKQTATSATKDSSSNNLYTYELKNNNLSVTFDGGEKYYSVPVDVDDLFFADSNKTVLLDGSYQIGLEKTAFLFGGKIISGKYVPLSVIYSDNKGVSWTSATITDLKDISFEYINYFDKDNGVIVLAHDKKDNEESSLILNTANGGETWSQVGNYNTFNMIRGALFVDSKTGFIDYEYQEGMSSNLYMTTDGGENFNPVTLGSQQFENSNTKLSWSSVYKDIQLPVLNDQGKLTLIISQGKSGDYNGGDSVAKYESNDNGNNWKYIGEE